MFGKPSLNVGSCIFCHCLDVGLWWPELASFFALLPLDQLIEGTIDRGSDFDAFVEVDGSNGTLGHTFWSEFEFLIVESASSTQLVLRSYLVDIFVGPGGAEAIQTELFVCVLLPAECRHNLHRQSWNTIRDH